jgi:UDP-N-acetylmuramate dehydrogenase
VVSPTDFADAGKRATSLARRTSFRIGGTPEFLFEPTTEEEAGAVIAACRRRGVPLRVLGGGCNVLVADGRLEGAVLATSAIRFERVLDDRVEVGAGGSFPSLVARAASLRVPALSGCPGIPGTVGGVVAMNAGGRFGCVGDALLEVRGFDPEGRPYARAVEPGDLGYRTTVFQGGVVTSVAFRRDAAMDVDAARRLFADASAWKRATQPLSAASAGCVFKNPFDSGPSGPRSGPSAPRSAGALIDGAGLKGERAGHAVVSPLHANFIVNEGGASFADVLALIDRVKARVAATNGVALELEVKVWR